MAIDRSFCTATECLFYDSFVTRICVDLIFNVKGNKHPGAYTYTHNLSELVGVALFIAHFMINR